MAPRRRRTLAGAAAAPGPCLLGALLAGLALCGCGDSGAGDTSSGFGTWDAGASDDAERGGGGGLVVIDPDDDDAASEAGDVASDAALGPLIAEPCGTGDDCPVERPACGLPGLCGQCADDGDCSGWERCVEGLCLGRLCETGHAVCAGSHVATCGSDGVSWEVLPCEAGLCGDGVCDACPAGAKACQDGVRVSCTTEGSWALAEPCSEETTCHRGECVACTVAGEPACAGTVAGDCEADGTLTPVEDCAELGLECAAGRCQSCAATTSRCEDDELWCEAGGESVLAADCAADGLTCFEGTCEAACQPEDLKDGVCEGEICCRSPDGAALPMEVEACEALGWSSTAFAVCQDAVCCETGVLAPHLTTAAACEIKVGQAVPGELCVPRLAAIPDALQFGPTVALCSEEEQVITLHSLGAVTVLITEWDLLPTCDAGFSLLPPAEVTLPLGLAPGESVDLTVRYDPSDLGFQTCGVVVGSSDPARPNTHVAVSGFSEPEFAVTEFFTAQGEVLVDVLFVVDTSGSMVDNLTNLAANIAAFTDLAGAWSADFRLGVTTTDVVQHAGALQGTPRFVTNADQAGFAANVPIDSAGSGDERGLEAAATALSGLALADGGTPCEVDADCNAAMVCVDGGCGGPNRGFLRDGAWLDIVFVSDEDDHSPGTVDAWRGLMTANPGTDPARLHAHAIVPPAGGCGAEEQAGDRYLQLAEATGGVAQSICAPDWANDLATLGDAVFDKPLALFPLASVPDATTLSVAVESSPCPANQDGGAPNWQYDTGHNAVHFPEGTTCAPQAGDEVRIDYFRKCQ